MRLRWSLIVPATKGSCVTKTSEIQVKSAPRRDESFPPAEVENPFKFFVIYSVMGPVLSCFFLYIVVVWTYSPDQSHLLDEIPEVSLSQVAGIYTVLVALLVALAFSGRGHRLDLKSLDWREIRKARENLATRLLTQAIALAVPGVGAIYCVTRWIHATDIKVIDILACSVVAFISLLLVLVASLVHPGPEQVIVQTQGKLERLESKEKALVGQEQSVAVSRIEPKKIYWAFGVHAAALSLLVIFGWWGTYESVIFQIQSSLLAIVLAIVIGGVLATTSGFVRFFGLFAWLSRIFMILFYALLVIGLIYSDDLAHNTRAYLTTVGILVFLFPWAVANSRFERESTSSIVFYPSFLHLHTLGVLIDTLTRQLKEQEIYADLMEEKCATQREVL